MHSNQMLWWYRKVSWIYFYAPSYLYRNFFHLSARTFLTSRALVRYNCQLVDHNSSKHLLDTTSVFTCINRIYRVFIKYCVFSSKCCDFSELCQFCCSAGVLPAWCVYTHWHQGKTEKDQSPAYSKIFGKNTLYNNNKISCFAFFQSSSHNEHHFIFDWRRRRWWWRRRGRGRMWCWWQRGAPHPATHPVRGGKKQT